MRLTTLNFILYVNLQTKQMQWKEVIFFILIYFSGLPNFQTPRVPALWLGCGRFLRQPALAARPAYGGAYESYKYTLPHVELRPDIFWTQKPKPPHPSRPTLTPKRACFLVFSNFSTSRSSVKKCQLAGTSLTRGAQTVLPAKKPLSVREKKMSRRK